MLSKSKGRSPKQARNTPELVPLDLPRTSRLSSFVDVVDRTRGRSDIVLSSGNSKLVTELVDETLQAEKYRRHGLPIRNKFLFCGPPGCGKTLCAEVFANEIGLDLLVVRLDGIITSYLGETASNLRSVIEVAERQPCVLFFDEFDALARTRSDAEGHGELRRVVNSLLLLIQNFKGRGALIAATNLEQSLDDALWRRFDEVLLFEEPTARLATEFLNLKTKNFKPNFSTAGQISKVKGMSYAQIERLCTQAIKYAIDGGRKKMAKDDFERALKEELRRQSIKRRISKRTG